MHHCKGVPNPICFMDNASLHPYRGLTRLIEELNVQIEYISPYYSLLDPIENIYSIWKSSVVRLSAQN